MVGLFLFNYQHCSSVCRNKRHCRPWLLTFLLETLSLPGSTDFSYIEVQPLTLIQTAYPATFHNMSDRDLRPPVPFRPDESQLHRMPRFKGNFVPRYLLRLYSPKTAGTTCLSHVIPPSVSSTSPQDSDDIFSLPEDEAAKRLNAHLRWWRTHEGTCNFMSWTTSLLFVLQYGLYRHRSEGSDLSDINLMILDTHEFSPKTFIKDMEIVEFFAPPSSGRPKPSVQKLESFRQLRRLRDCQYYFGEYLSQGDLDLTGRCVQVSLRTLLDLDLFRLMPELANEEHWGKWADAVLRVREPLKERKHLETTHDEVHKAITIAKSAFGGPWAIPVAAMLLSMKPRMTDDNIVIDGFKSMFSCGLSLYRIQITLQRLIAFSGRA